MSRYFGSRGNLQGTWLPGNTNGFRRETSQYRKAVLDRLKRVSRVNGPESDMRPVLPKRTKLMAALAAAHVKEVSPTRVYSRVRSKKHLFLSSLASRAATAAKSGNLDDIWKVAQDASVASYPVDHTKALRIVALSAINNSCASRKHGIVAEDILSRFAAEGLLGTLEKADIGMILDAMARRMIVSREFSGAFRVEQLSRLFEVELGRGTYTQLIRVAGLEAGSASLARALGTFHRALVVGKEPNAAMFNVLLEVCFKAGDGPRARRVLAEMARERIAINGSTLSVLLRYTETVEHVDSVFSLLKTQVQEGKAHATPGMALEFVRAYISSSKAESNQADPRHMIKGAHVDYIGRSFALVDWFYETGVGVTNAVLDMLVCHLGEKRNAEGALRAWREMRRGWLGSPSRRGRRSLVTAVSHSDLPARVDTVILPKLESCMGQREQRRVRRLRLSLKDDAHDINVVNKFHTKWDVEEERDIAAIVHRWVREGRGSAAQEFVEGRIKRHALIHYRVLLALLASQEPGHLPPVRTSGSSNDDLVFRLRFVVSQLASGLDIRVSTREHLVRRVTKAVLDIPWSSSDSSSLIGVLGEYSRSMSTNMKLGEWQPGTGTKLDYKTLYRFLDSIVTVVPVDGF